MYVDFIQRHLISHILPSVGANDSTNKNKSIFHHTDNKQNKYVFTND